LFCKINKIILFRSCFHGLTELCLFNKRILFLKRNNKRSLIFLRLIILYLLWFHLVLRLPNAISCLFIFLHCVFVVIFISLFRLFSIVMRNLFASHWFIRIRLIAYILNYFKFILHAFIFRVLFRSVWTFIRIIFRLNIAIISIRIIWFAKIFILIFHLFLVIAVIILIFLRCLIALVFWIFIIFILWCIYFKDFIIFWIIIF